MYVFPELKLIYIKVPGTGGSSFYQSMKKKYDHYMINIHQNDPIRRINDIKMDSHLFARQARQGIDPKIWHDYEKIGFVRCPWNWILSLYQKPNLKKFIGMNSDRPLSEFVSDIELTPYDWFVDDSGRVIIDRIYRTEDLGLYIFDKYGIEHKHIRSRNRHAPQKFTRDDFTPEDIRKISFRFEREWSHYYEIPGEDF